MEAMPKDAWALPRIVLWTAILGLVLGADGPPPARAPQDASKPAAPSARPARKSLRKTARPRGARTVAGQPPGCPNHARPARPQRPVAPTMPDLFLRMGESFVRNPATAFPNFVRELSDDEGPALGAVSLSPAEERAAGERARAEYLARAAQRGYRVVNDPRKLAYLRALVGRFAPHMLHRARYPKIEVGLIDSPVSEAQSFPGGSIVFTTALLEEPDEATVAGVVAHELAHLDRGHLYEYARRGKLAETTFARPPAAGESFDEFFRRGMTVFGMMMNPFRPEHELEADCTATTWMYQEGYDPHALVGYFERLHRELNDPPIDPRFPFWRSHPYSLDRRREVLDRLAQLKRWRPGQEVGLYPDNLRRLQVRQAAGPDND